MSYKHRDWQFPIPQVIKNWEDITKADRHCLIADRAAHERDGPH